MMYRLKTILASNAWACAMIGVSLIAYFLPNGEKLLHDIYLNTDPQSWDDEGEG